MLAAALLAAAIAPATASSPLLGRYAVRAGGAACTLVLSFEPTVGGEVEASGSCPAPVADAARWDSDGAGGFVLFDPLRKRVGAVAEDEAGYTLVVRDNRRFAVSRLDAPRMRTDAERATGWWSVRTADPAKVDCRIELRAGGRVGPAACAPVKPFGGGRWSADKSGVRLTSAAGKTLAFRWGDAVSLIGPKGTVLLTHD